MSGRVQLASLERKQCKTLLSSEVGGEGKAACPCNNSGRA